MLSRGADNPLYFKSLQLRTQMTPFYFQVVPDNEEQKRFAVGSRYLTACFSQPGGASNFLQRVADQKVVLENCLVDDTDMLVTGSVRVSNVAFHKKVGLIPFVQLCLHNYSSIFDI